MQNELHSAGFIEETLHHECLLRRKCTERAISIGEIIGDLLSGVSGQLQFVEEPLSILQGKLSASPADKRLSISPREIGYSVGQFRSSRRRFAEPERNSGRLAVRIFDANHAGIDAQNLPRRVAELKDIAGQTFDGEIFVHRADERFGGFEDDAIIGVVGNRAAGRECEQARAAPAADAMIDGVVMNQRGASAAFGAETFGQHFHDAVEFFAREIAIRIGRAHKLEQIVLVPILGRTGSDDLLGEDVERFFGNLEAIEFAVANRCRNAATRPVHRG